MERQLSIPKSLYFPHLFWQRTRRRLPSILWEVGLTASFLEMRQT